MYAGQEGNTYMKWFLRLLFTVLILAGWMILAYQYILFTLESPTRTKQIELEIKPNATLKEIGQSLEKAGLIRSATFFRYYAWWKQNTNLKPGYYEIGVNENLNQIMSRLHDGEQSMVKVTIPEGKTVLEIADILEKHGFDKQDFLKKVNQKQSNYAFETEITPNPNRQFRYEGYLFPNTYHFRKNETSEKIIKEMLDEFAKRMTQLQVRDKLKERNMTVDQWVTFASIVEREGQEKQELPRIAGVIYNRLDKKMRLEVDATIVYAMKLKGVNGKIRTNFASPYNTYQNNGLPPGPISCPGESSLAAVLNPEQNPYFYYVTKSDGSGQHYFARTIQEHQKNIQLSNKNEGR